MKKGMLRDTPESDRMPKAQNILRIVLQSKTIVFDTNLLFPFLVFLSYGKTAKNIEILEMLIRRMGKRIVITPHILAEVGNLAKRDFKNDADYADFIRKANETITRTDELFVKKEDIIKEPAVAKFGYTDISLIGAQRQSESSFILSDDGAFVALCRSRDIPAVTLEELVSIKEA